MKNNLKTDLPKITFSVVTLNEEKRIRRCLDAINAQQYPKEKIEIIVMDGGSNDRTVAVAEEYSTKIYFNKRKLAEPGLVEAYEKATGDYMVFMAADNIIFDKKWTKKIIQPFLDNPEGVFASFSRVTNDQKDNIWNKYMNEDVEPFSAFVFGNASHPDKFGKIYSIQKETPDYVIYNYTLKDFPLIALAQCTILKTKLRRKGSHFDDILPLIEIINDGGKIAYVKNTGVYHYSINNFSNMCQKFKRRIYNSIMTNSFASREEYVSSTRKIKRYIFLIYGLTILFPLIDGIGMTLQKRKFYMLLHPIVCFIISFYILFNFLQISLWKK